MHVAIVAATSCTVYAVYINMNIVYIHCRILRVNFRDNLLHVDPCPADEHEATTHIQHTNKIVV